MARVQRPPARSSTWHATACHRRPTHPISSTVRTPRVRAHAPPQLHPSDRLRRHRRRRAVGRRLRSARRVARRGEGCRPVAAMVVELATVWTLLDGGDVDVVRRDTHPICIYIAEMHARDIPCVMMHISGTTSTCGAPPCSTRYYGGANSSSSRRRRRYRAHSQPHPTSAPHPRRNLQPSVPRPTRVPVCAQPNLEIFRAWGRAHEAPGGSFPANLEGAKYVLLCAGQARLHNNTTTTRRRQPCGGNYNSTQQHRAVVPPALIELCTTTPGALPPIWLDPRRLHTVRRRRARMELAAEGAAAYRPLGAPIELGGADHFGAAR